MLISLFGAPAIAAPPSLDFRSLASDPQWVKLLHYRSTWWGRESDVDSPGFFLGKNGKKDGVAELRAFVEELQNPNALTEPEDKSVLCRFPARYEWLKKKTLSAGISWPSRKCELLDRFREAIRGPSVSLIFSSYYLNNPSSAFGHTFLRVNKAPDQKSGQRHELLDYGLNFAASMDTGNPFLYSVKGLFGAFPGKFTSIPYYFKVREYNNHESRDLWQYELSLTPDEVNTLIDHLWELGPHWIDYWYLTENCSFHMITVLEAAAPRLELVSRLKKYVVPADTLRVLAETPGLISEITYRPSIRTQLLTRVALLDAEEKNQALQIVKRQDLSALDEARDPARQSLVLDAALDLIDFRYPLEVQIETDPVTRFKNKVLARRGANPTVSRPLKIQMPEKDQPQLSHPSGRAGLGWRKQKEGSGSFLLKHRFSLHDLYDGSAGYLNGSQIVMFETDFSYNEESRALYLDKFNLFEVISRSPWTLLTPAISWQLKVASERGLWPKTGEVGSVGEISFGSGLTTTLLSPDFTAFFGARASLLSFLDGRADAFQPTIGPAFGFLAKLTPTLNLGFEGWWRREQEPSFRRDLRELDVTLHWQARKNLGLRMVGRERAGAQAAELQILGYY